MLIINPIPIHLAAFYLHRDKMTLLLIECSSGYLGTRLIASRAVVLCCICCLISVMTSIPNHVITHARPISIFQRYELRSTEKRVC
jgi:hypothetical protein